MVYRVKDSDTFDGPSAYDVAVDNGFVGTEADWLASLGGIPGPEGPEGPEGPAGPPGADGADGAAGAPGADGADGADAVEQLVSNVQTGTTYNVVASDQGKLIQGNNATGCDITIPSGVMPADAVIHVMWRGVGVTRVLPGGGVTFNDPSNGTTALTSVTLPSRNAIVKFVQRATDTWVVEPLRIDDSTDGTLPKTTAAGAALHAKPCFAHTFRRDLIAGNNVTGAPGLVATPIRFRVGQVVHAIGAIHTGAAVNNTRLVGIYDESFNKLAEGTNTSNWPNGDPKAIALTSSWTCPATGTYYIAFASAVAHTLAKGPGSPSGANSMKPYVGWTQAIGTMPATATPVAPATPTVYYFMIFGDDVN